MTRLELTSSARISTARAPVFVVETKASLLVTKTSEPPAAQPSDNAPNLPSGSGSDLPAIEGIAWELKPDGSIEAWHAPQGRRTPRRLKTYLGRVGRRKLTEWEALTADRRRDVVEQWVADRRAEKGID